MAIHEQNYVRYDGPLRTGRAWATIAWMGLRTYLSFLRTKLTLLLLWLMSLLYAVFIFLEYSLRNSALGNEMTAPPSSYVSFFLQTQVISVVVLLLASGCGVISEDLRYRTFQLYFSKPLERWEYAVGKFGSLLLLTSLVSVIPAGVLAVLRGATRPFARNVVVNEYPKSGGSWLSGMIAEALDLPFPQYRLPMIGSCLMQCHVLNPWNMRNVVVIWREHQLGLERGKARSLTDHKP